jgi:hypothetical protein
MTQAKTREICDTRAMRHIQDQDTDKQTKAADVINMDVTEQEHDCVHGVSLCLQQALPLLHSFSSLHHIITSYTSRSCVAPTVQLKQQ